MRLDPQHCYAALKARDSRFDGGFFVGVSTTGIYCRPICTARTPKRDHCRFFANAAAAESAGFRPCLRCRPEIAPGVARGVAPVDAVRGAAHWLASRIEEGAMNDGGSERLASEYGLSSRQLRRALIAEYGVTPIELAQTRRLLLAKQLLTETSLPLARVAFASGFSSVRRFNACFRSRYRLNPGALRKRQAPRADASVVLQLAYRPPLAWDALREFLVTRGAAGVEAADGARYVRTVALHGKRGWISATPLEHKPALQVEVAVDLLAVLTPLLARLRRMFDLDANPAIIEERLRDDARMRRLLRRRPGLRVPGAFDGFELALRAVLGQQVSVKAASTLFSRFAETFGAAAATPYPQLRRHAPTAEAVAQAPVQRLRDLGLTRQRAASASALARAVADGKLVLEPGGAVAPTLERLLELPGIGPWTAQYIAMRALRDADALPPGDLGLLKALRLDHPRKVIEHAQKWQPWRAYAALHLWTEMSAGG
ncbi:MAG TPA: AlkA N-terminal domain-containing protein [Burkholderiaceae bacterium]|nr:AlkA N-terminal domain-containing protein [Burkholderiaceae bacterium]